MMAFVNEKTEDGQWQTIDRERNLVLRKTKGGIEGPTEFKLYVGREEIRFLAYQTVDNFKNKNDYIKWYVVKCYLPKSLKKKKKYARDLIEESLDGYGFASSREHVKKLEVTFEPNLLEN